MALTYRAPLAYRTPPQRVAFNTPNAFTGIRLGLMPLGARPASVYCDCSWAFNNGAYAQIGFTVGGAEWEFSLDLTSTGRKHAMTYVDTAAPLAADREVWLRILHNAGTPPTRGWANFVAEWA